MAYKLDLNQLVGKLRGPRGLEALVDEAQKLSQEVKRFKSTLKPQAEAKLKEARTRLGQLDKLIKKSQKDFESEIKSSLTRVRDQAYQAEKELVQILKGKKQQPARKSKASTTRAKRKA